MIKDSTITNDDVSPTANIAASKILVGAIAPHQPLSAQTHVSNLWGTIGYVVGQTGNELYSSVQDAIDAAVAAGFGPNRPVTIEVKPGTYNESLTFRTNIHLKAEIEDALFSVTIIGTNQYVDDTAGLDELYISGIWFISRATDTAPTFSIAGSGFASIRMNHCVLYSGNNEPALRLSNIGSQPDRLSNTEMFHCRIRNTLANFTGPALVELNAGSLLLDDGEATLEDNAEISFLASGTSQLILDNAEINGRIETEDTAYLQITQSSIDSGAQPSIVHNSTETAIVLELLLISTLSGNVVTVTAESGDFLYSNIGYFYSAYGLAQTLPAAAVLIRTEMDHGLLRGLADDDHGQYHNNDRGDTRYAGADWDGVTRLVNAQGHIARTDNPHAVTLDQLNYSRRQPGYGTRGEPNREEIELWGDANDWDQDDHALVNHSTLETDPQVGTIENNLVPRWNSATTQLVSGTIFDNGNVGIGALSSVYKLDVNGDAGVRGAAVVYGPLLALGNVRADEIRTITASPTPYFQHLTLRAYAGTEARTVLVPALAGFRITDYMNQDINFEFENDGDLYLPLGYVTEGSDSRIKLNQQPLDYGLEQILALNPKRYMLADWIRDEESDDMQIEEGESTDDIGLIAQDVYEVIPEAVRVPKDETRELWGVAYSKLVTVLVKAVQEQQQQIESLKQRIATLEQR